MNYDFLIRAPSRLRLDGYTFLFNDFLHSSGPKKFYIETHLQKMELHLKNVIYFKMTQQKFSKRKKKLFFEVTLKVQRL